MKDDKWATLLWMPIGFLAPQPTFKKGVEVIMRTIISKTLFQDRVIASHALLEGF